MFKKNILAVIFCILSGVDTFSQKITFDPIDWQSTDTLTIKFDFTATSYHDYTDDLYFWAWVENGANQPINCPHNGSWTMSDPSSKLTYLGDHLYSFSFLPEKYFELDSIFFAVKGFNFLIKRLNGDDKTGGFQGKTSDWTGLTSYLNFGTVPITRWNPSKPVTLFTDLQNFSLTGSLYYWGWYTSGSIDTNSPNNGDWTNSNTASQMTNVRNSLWKKDFIPEKYFSANAANLSGQTLAGLVKKQNGNDGKSDDFGLNKPFKKYLIVQKNASNVVLNPSNPSLYEPVTITFHAANDLLNSNQSVFLHAGLAKDSYSGMIWENAQGIWGDSLSSPGKMTKIAKDTYQIQLSSIQSYFQLEDKETAFKILCVFRSADGTKQEKDGNQDFQLPIAQTQYLQVREPFGKFILKNLNEPFRITGYTNKMSDMIISVNGQNILTKSNTQRITTLFTPTIPGNHTVIIRTADGTLSDTLQIAVCDVKSGSALSTLPSGMHYGLNYDTQDFTKVTLVLHAPTESIESVHIIGDFNDWNVQCDYAMNYDSTLKVFWKTIRNLTPKKEYVFQYLINGKARIGEPYADKVSDPWHDHNIPNTIYPELIPYPEAARPRVREIPTMATVLQTNSPRYAWENTNFKKNTPKAFKYLSAAF